MRLPADTELALYRILQETLKNVEKHARARHVTVYLTKEGNFVQLTINDDGIGFDQDHHPARRKGKGGFGLFGMRERTSYVGGTLIVESARGKGTTIHAQVPLIDRSRGDRKSRTNPTRKGILSLGRGGTRPYR